MPGYHKFDRADLRRLLTQDPRPTYKAMGAALGVSAVAVWRAVQRLDVPARQGNYKLSTGKAEWR